MKEPRFQPIAVRLIRAILAWSLLMSLALSACVGWWAHREASAQVNAALRQQGEALARNVAEALWQVSPDLIQPHISTVASWPGVDYVEVAEPAGGARFAVSGSAGKQHRHADIQLPIIRDARPIGTLRIDIDQAAIDRIAMQAALKSMASSLVLVALVLGVELVMLRRQLQLPMQELAGFLRGLGANQLDQRLLLQRPPKPSQDELDLVAEGIASLQARIAGHVRELDARVAERTEQLQTALDTLKTLAVTDPLTGCHNRLAFTQKYPDALTHAERYARPLSIVFCDVDRFKAINDNHGHPAGDRVLAAMGQWLRTTLRGSSDWVARYGGEEFVLVLPETPLAQALEVAERLRVLVEQSEGVATEGGRQLHVTVSLGVAQWQAGEMQPPLQVIA
ncbi:MAG: diguanylate cyclase [Burkholderiales bacterium]|nr:diguanylate cyclase [Burkholderiales bacterium]